jgi:hypothetical protein
MFASGCSRRDLRYLRVTSSGRSVRFESPLDDGGTADCALLDR